MMFSCKFHFNKNTSLKLKIEFNEEKISVTMSIGLVCAIIRNDKINIKKLLIS